MAFFRDMVFSWRIRLKVYDKGNHASQNVLLNLLSKRKGLFRENGFSTFPKKFITYRSGRWRHVFGVINTVIGLSF